MLSKANQGELEGAFQAAQSLASQHGQLGTTALESLIAPHIKDGRSALKRAINAGPTSPTWDDAARFATTARMLAPKSHIPATLLGDIALARGHADKAIEHYQFALSVDQTYIPALEGIARWARLRRHHGRGGPGVAISALLQRRADRRTAGGGEAGAPGTLAGSQSKGPVGLSQAAARAETMSAAGGS